MRFSIVVFPALIAAPVFADPPTVVADIAPVHALLSQVMNGVATPQLLLDQTANPHSVQLKPSQARMLAAADLLIWVGPELSPWLEGIVGTQVDDHIALTAQAATHLREFGDAGAAEDDHAHDHDVDHHEAESEDADDDHAHDDGHDDEHVDLHDGEDHGGEDHGGADHGGADHGDADHDDHTDMAHGGGGDMDHADHPEAAHTDHVHTGVDPHVWLSTENARAWLGIFAETLSERDPDNAAIYRANAAEATAGIDALEVRVESRLAAHQGAEIVTFHESFGYFAEQFGIDIAGSVRPGDATAPSAAAMATLRDLVADHGIECAFAEPAFDPGLLDAIAGGTGLRIGTLDPTGALLATGAGHYTSTLTGVAEAIADCLEQN